MLQRLQLAWALLLLLLGACAPPVTGPGGITLLTATLGDSLDEMTIGDADTWLVMQLVTPGLITFDDSGDASPDLAERFHFLDPQTLEVSVRGLAFHDGSPLTARDVQATFEGLPERDPLPGKLKPFEPIERVELRDERTVWFHLRQPFTPILAQLTTAIVPEARARKPGVAAQVVSPIGAGPFRFVSRSDEDHLELAPFEGYYRGKPAISRLQVRRVPNENTRVLELLRGDGDLTTRISPPLLGPIQEAPHLSVVTARGSSFGGLLFNMRSGPTADARVRHALCLSLQLEDIVRYKFHGLAVQATGMLPADHWAYASGTGCHHDLAAAGRLLNEAGYPEDADHRRPLSLTYKTTTNPFRRSIALALASQMRALGIDVTVRSEDATIYLWDLAHGNFELAAPVWQAVIEPDLLRQAFSTPFIPGPGNGFSGFNRAAYRNPELDDLVERAAGAPPEGRSAPYARALAILDRDLPCAPLWHEHSLYVLSDRLAGFVPSAHGLLTPLAGAREVIRE